MVSATSSQLSCELEVRLVEGKTQTVFETDVNPGHLAWQRPSWIFQSLAVLEFIRHREMEKGKL